MSDNGPEGQDTEGPLSNAELAKWFADVSNPDIEAVGNGDVWAFTGTNWSHAQSGVLGWFKWFVSEGGVRVPLIVVPPTSSEFARSGARTAEFASVKDVPATILDYAGVSAPGSEYKGRKIIPASGISLRGFLTGSVERPRSEDSTYFFELFGNAYAVQGDYKALLVRKGMWGSGEWNLYDIRNDPGETKSLNAELPEKLEHLKDAYYEFASQKKLVPVSDNWNPWYGFVDLETFNE